MSLPLILRVISNAGRSRVELKTNSPFLELKQEVAERLGVEVDSLKIFHDPSYLQPIRGDNNDTLQWIGLKHGDMIYVANTEIHLTPKKEKPKFKLDLKDIESGKETALLNRMES
mgnify:CR=1 FL=1